METGHTILEPLRDVEVGEEFIFDYHFDLSKDDSPTMTPSKKTAKRARYSRVKLCRRVVLDVVTAATDTVSAVVH